MSLSNRINMPDPSSIFHPRPTANEPPRKRAKIAHEELERRPLNLSSHFFNYKVNRQSISTTKPRSRTTDIAIMAEPIPTTNTYTTHTSLETISLKIKKLQSDLSSAATGQCWGPGKQKVLDCKHDVDVLALMVKELEVDGTA